MCTLTLMANMNVWLNLRSVVFRFHKRGNLPMQSWKDAFTITSKMFLIRTRVLFVSLLLFFGLFLCFFSFSRIN